VGAPRQDNQKGAVLVFRRDGGTWVEAGRLEAEGLGAGAQFGGAIALAGDLAFVGAPRQDGTGTVFAFRRDGDAWTPAGTITPDDGERGNAFGAALLVRDGVLLVGSPLHGAGAVYSYRVDGESFEPHGKLVPFDGARRDVFGAAMAWNGGELWVGSPRAGRGSGVIYVFEHGEGGVTGVRKVASPVAGRASFGQAIAAAEGVVVAGLTGADNGAGLAAVFEAGEEPRLAATLASPPEGMDPVTGGEVACTGGNAAGWDCGDVDLVSFLPVSAIGGGRGVRLNDIWGWTDPETGKEYAIVGRLDGTSFVDISDPANPVYVGNLTRTEGTQPSTWRDMKVYKNHVFIVADGAPGHGVQIMDLTKLRDFAGEPIEFTEDAHYDGVSSVHNIVINEETGFAYTVGNRAGGETCGGGSHIINIQDPLNPTFAGCFAHPETGRQGTGYTHDAQCVVYRGPDEDYQGREVCFNANETALSIADVTDKENPVPIAAPTYPNVGYAHQGWLTEDQHYFFMDDELDELQGKVERTRTLIWDVSDLDDPQLVGEYLGTTSATDHNLYIRGNLMYQSDYQAGLRIIDISNPLEPKEVAYFDTVPYGTNTPGFGGSWSNYPFFESGVVIVTSGNEGLFVLRKRETVF